MENTIKKQRKNVMKEFKFTILDKNGLHARPAGTITSVAKGFSSKIDVYCGEKQADAKRLLSLMSLGATKGMELTFEIIGEDEALACKALKEVCEEKLG